MPGRTDGLVIKRVHTPDLGGVQDYQDTIAAQNLYTTEVAWCVDPKCKSFDITRPNGRDD